MKRGNIQRANQIDADITRIDELIALHSKGEYTLRYQLMHDKNGVFGEGLRDERWAEMSQGITKDLEENFFSRLAHMRKQLMDELEKL